MLIKIDEEGRYIPKDSSDKKTSEYKIYNFEEITSMEPGTFVSIIANKDLPEIYRRLFDLGEWYYSVERLIMDSGMAYYYERSKELPQEEFEKDDPNPFPYIIGEEEAQIELLKIKKDISPLRDSIYSLINSQDDLKKYLSGIIFIVDEYIKYVTSFFNFTLSETKSEIVISGYPLGLDRVVHDIWSLLVIIRKHLVETKLISKTVMDFPFLYGYPEFYGNEDYEKSKYNGIEIKKVQLINQLTVDEYYEINSFYDLAVLDLSLFISKGNIIKICENCRNYFIPLNRKDEKYCTRKNLDEKRCNEVGAQLKYKRKQTENPISNLRQKFYNSIYAATVRKHRNNPKRKEGAYNNLKIIMTEFDMQVDRINNTNGDERLVLEKDLRDWVETKKTEILGGGS